ncbi:MAG: hypothetical protein R3330_17255, partial [Saprospiraceae bacterium]|nr:hypothetical protein [Saprospiraceae bacterium]
VLRLSWTSTRPVTAHPDDVLFSVIVAIGHGNALSLQSVPQDLAPEAYHRGVAHEMQVETLAQPQLEPEEPMPELRPNPFSRSCEISFNLATSGQVACTVRDVSGRILYHTVNFYPAGRSSISVDRAAIGAYRGMMVCTLTSAAWTHTASLMIIE